MISFPKAYSIAKKKKALILAWICLFFAVVFPIVGIVDTLLNLSREFWNVFIVFVFWFLMWSAMSYMVYKWAMTAKLVISENKIDCDDIASLAGFSTNWENIEFVLVSKMRLILYLKEPSEPITKLGKWVIDHNWTNPNVIDLSSFIDHWKSGELKQDFAQCAPYLFDEEGKLKSELA